MRSAIMEGLDLAQQLAAMPFKAARQVLRDTPAGRRPLGEVVQDSLLIGEDLARLPFKISQALIAETSGAAPSLEERVANLEKRLGVTQPAPPEQPVPEPSQSAELPENPT